MTATGTTGSATPPVPSGGPGLPPPLPSTFDPGSTTAGGSTPSTTLPATSGSTTSFAPATGGGATYPTIPAPSSCPTPPPVVGKDPMQGPIQQTSGGGAVGADALAPILSQLTAVIGQLSTAVGGVSGGGAPGKTPDQAPPKTPVQGGGAAPTTPPPTTPAPASNVAGAAGGGAVAGAAGAAPADASQGAHAVQGGGATSEALITALKGVIEALNALVAALSGGVIGGGAPGKTPVQGPPSKELPPPTDMPPVPGDVAGDQGPGQKDPGQKPGQVGGDQGPGQKDPGQKPPSEPPTTPPPGNVGGENGPGQHPGQTPGQHPGQFPGQVPTTPPPTDVDGEKGPGKDPGQKPPDVPTPPKGGPVEPPKPPKPPKVPTGEVVIDNEDGKFSVKVREKAGKDPFSVELWGDPHVVIDGNGETQRFDIGFGSGKVKLFDGTVITWNTFGKDAKTPFVMKDFKVNSAGTKYDQSVTTADGKDEKGLPTALTERHLKEFAAALRSMKGPMDKPLQNGTWVSPDFGKTPAQTTVLQGSATA